MKIFKFMIVALVAMCGLNSCSEDCDHDFIEVDYSKALVGTWTCMDMDYAEALVINADGSLTATGVVDGEYYETKGIIQVKNNKMIYKLDNGDEWEGRFEMTTGESFTMVLSEELDIRYTYRYCENDLADEAVGMWVCHEGLPGVENDMAIKTYSENGKMAMTTQTSAFIDKDLVGVESDYKVIGNLLFIMLPKDNVTEGKIPYLVSQLTYIPNGTSLGDILTEKSYVAFNDGNVIYSTASFLRISQSLDLAGNAYDYNNTYVSNVKGLDEDMTMMGYTFNIGKMEGKNLDKMLKTLLFAVEFPNANTLKYQYHYNGQNFVFEVPIVVDGNKVTIKMSEMYPYYRDVDMYMFQDQDDCQLHMYMPTSSFINYFGNMDVAALAFAGEIDVTDTAAVEAIFDRMDERVESINVSFTFKAAK